MTLDDLKEWVDAADPLTAYVELTRLEKQIKALKDSVQYNAVVEAQKYGKTFSFAGYEIQCKNAAGRWKYDHIPAWKQQQALLKKYEEDAKHAYKAKQAGQTMVDANGEVIEPADYTAGAEIISLTEIKKNENI